MSLRERLPVLGGEPAEVRPFLDRAAAWATDLSYRDVPAPVRRAARAQLAGAVGAALWTRSHPLGDRIAGATDTSSGNATFLAGGELLPEDAASGNAALSVALGFDDSVLGGHTGAGSVFVPLAYAEADATDRRQALAAQVAANEVAARLGAAAAIGPFRGPESTYLHAAAAAVGRAVVEDDSAETLADALGTALLQPPWPLEPPFVGSDAGVWSASEPIRSGLAAVESAREGLSGRPDLVEADAGLLAEFADLPVPAFLEGLGERWHTHALTVAPTPGRVWVTAPVEAALETRGRFDRGRTEVERIDVYGSAFAIRGNDRAEAYLDGPESPLRALSGSVAYNVAAALLGGERTPNRIGDRPADGDVRELADRVSLHHDSSFTVAALDSAVPVGAAYRRAGPRAIGHAAGAIGAAAAVRHLPTLLGLVRKRPIPADLSEADERIGARVEVTIAGGRTVESTVEHPSGFAGRPLAERRAVARKRCRAALEARGVGEADARRRVRELLSFEDAEPVSLALVVDGIERTGEQATA